MSNATTDRRTIWSPPPRPDWVTRVNQEGSYMDLSGVVPLDARSLIDTAIRNTGLTDFGSDDWREPFQIFVKSLDEEAHLNLMGRLMGRSDILNFLQARLQIEDTYKRHPEIDDEQIVAPFLVMGQGRSGTSALLNLLAADPDNGAPKIWEAVFPCPPPEAATYRSDPRIARADKLMTMWYRVTPEVQGVHEVDGDIPTESIHLDCLSFQSPSWLSLLGPAPSFLAYMSQRSDENVYAYEKRTLKLLQWKNPRRRWVLKTPQYLLYIPRMLQVFPDARFIWIHRDPVVALSSLVNMMGTLNWVRSDKVFVDNTHAAWTTLEPIAAMMSQPIDWLEQGVLPRGQLCNVQFQDFIKDPPGVVKQIYDHYGIDLTESQRAALQAHVDHARHESRPRHRYETGSSETVLKDRAAFAKYQNYFNVPNEL